MEIKPLTEAEKGILHAERSRCTSDALITFFVLVLLLPLILLRLQQRHSGFFENGNFFEYIAVGILAAGLFAGAWYWWRRRFLEKALRQGQKEVHQLEVVQVVRGKGKKTLYTRSDRSALKKITFFGVAEIHPGDRIQVHYIPQAAIVVQVECL